MADQDKLFIRQVKFSPILPEITGELSDEIFRRCCFCEKTCQTLPEQSQLIQKLSGPRNFFCSFCLRHNFNTKNSRDVLIMSFRSIIGYLYFQHYLCISKQNKLWISEIQDYIFAHEDAGLVNPLFLYDSETMLWFIDFSKVGISRKKIPLSEILKTIISILSTFNLSSTAPEIAMSGLYEKFKHAVVNFYEQRHRPENKKILIPTFSGLMTEPINFSFDRTRNFIFEDLQMKK